MYTNDVDVWNSLKRSGMINDHFDLMIQYGDQNISSDYFIDDGVVHSRDDFDYGDYMSKDVEIFTQITEKKDWDTTLEEVAWNHYSTGKKMGQTSTLPHRLNTIRNWLSSPYFPEDFRLRIQTEISKGAKANMDLRDREYLTALHASFETINWNSYDINDCVCQQAKDRGMKLRDAFQLMYWIVLDQGFGPKLASILGEMDRKAVLSLLQSAIDELSA